MMNLTTVPLFKLIDMIGEYTKSGNQLAVNEVALEIARRWWYPECGKTKEEYLESYGYKKIEKNGGKIKKK